MLTFQGTVAHLLTHLGYTISMSQGRRIVAQGAVKINDVAITDLTSVFDFKPSDKIQVGKDNPIHLGQFKLG
jgi:tyrosyl-tRNA synthetase